MQKQKMYLTAESIYKYLVGKDEKIDTLVMCKGESVNLITTDQSLYEAVGSIEDRSKIDMNKLVKLLEVVEIRSFVDMMKKSRSILKPERVDEIKKKTENKKDEDKIGDSLKQDAGTSKK